MKPSRIIAFIAGYFALVVGIIMTVLSAGSILAYYCHFKDIFKQSPIGYMFHLIYYRSHHCDSSIDWTILGIDKGTDLIEPQMPHEIASVTRTFWIAVIQVVFNCLLVVTAVIMLASTHSFLLWGTRRWTYWIFFAPLCLVLFSTNLVDMITAWFYSIDRSRSFSTDGAMTLLEITNRIEARPFVDQIDIAYRSVPPTVMLYVSLKGIIGLILCILVLFFVTLTGWEVVDGSKRRKAQEYVTHIKKTDQL